MLSTNFNIHGVDVNFISNHKEIFYQVKSELRHTLVHPVAYKKDKIFYFWAGNQRTAPSPLKKMITNNPLEVINKQIQTVVDYRPLHAAVLANSSFNHDEALLACVSLIGYLVRFALFRRIEAVGFHTAGVSLKNKAILLPGQSGSGKSTLSYYFAASGYKILSDEECLLQIDNSKVVVYGLARFLRLDEDFFQSKEGLTLKKKMKLRPYEAFGEKGYTIDLRFFNPRIFQRKANLKLICTLVNKCVDEPKIKLLEHQEAFEFLLDCFESTAINKNNDPMTNFLQKYNEIGFRVCETLVQNYPIYQLTYNIETQGPLVPQLIKELFNQTLYSERIT